MSFDIRVDVFNPGQAFACCGLFELASRLDGHATARFEGERFVVDAALGLGELLEQLARTRLVVLDEENKTESALQLEGPSGLRLDWWQDRYAGGRDLKTWAGTMECPRIALAMLAASLTGTRDQELLDREHVVHDHRGKVEPFYFDARRSSNTHPRDVGFSLNDLSMETAASPTTEAFALIGLQRCRPRLASRSQRLFEYSTWPQPLDVTVASAVMSGAMNGNGETYRFENWFRTGQKKHKAFRMATRVEQGGA